MRHFEHVGAPDFIFRQHVALDGTFRVSREQEPVAPVAQAQDQRVVVFRAVRGDVIGGRGEDLDFSAAEGESARGMHGDDFDAVGCGLGA